MRSAKLRKYEITMYKVSNKNVKLTLKLLLNAGSRINAGSLINAGVLRRVF